MAVPSGTYQTFQQKGLREDLSDLIDDISPTEKPFTRAIGRTSAKATKHEWQTDVLATASATNANIQGDDSAVNTAVPTVRLGNFTQIIKKTVQASRTARTVRAAGRADEFNYQLKKRMAEVGRDLEASLTQNNAATAGSAASAALMASLESWLSTNRTSVGTGTAQTTPGADASLGYPATAPTDSTVTGTLNESDLKAVIRSAWTSGGEPSMIMVGPGTKQKISGSFTGIATRFRDVPSGKAAEITGAADLYVSDFGEFKIVPNRFQRDRTLFVLDTEHFKLATLDGFTMERLAKTGDSDKAHIVGEFTLEVGNEAASGKITDINPAL